MSPTDSRHGTPSQPISQRVSGCDCDRCDAARRLWRRNRKMREMGRPALVDVTRVRDHIDRLIAAGWSPARIGKQSGVSAATISDVQHHVSKQMRADTAARLLQLSPANPSSWGVSSLGTIRRLQALAAIGWPIRQTCERAGLSPRFGALAMGKQRTSITTTSAEKIDAVYRELSMTPAPDTVVHNHCRSVARNRGWAPPLAWDDIDNDPKPTRASRYKDWSVYVDEALVDRVINGERRPRQLNNGEAAEVVRRLKASGLSGQQIETRYGLKPDRYPSGEVA